MKWLLLLLPIFFLSCGALEGVYLNKKPNQIVIPKNNNQTDSFKDLEQFRKNQLKSIKQFIENYTYSFDELEQKQNSEDAIRNLLKSLEE